MEPIFLSDDKRYLVYRARGKITRAMALEYAVQLNKAAQVHKISRFLIDVRDSVDVSSNAEHHQLINNDIPRAPGFGPLGRSAVLVSPGDDSRNFVEVIAKNKGMDLTVFNNYDLAVRYLLED